MLCFKTCMLLYMWYNIPRLQMSNFSTQEGAMKLFFVYTVLFFLAISSVGCVQCGGNGYYGRRNVGNWSSNSSYKKGNTTVRKSESCHNGHCTKNSTYSTRLKNGRVRVRTRVDRNGRTTRTIRYHGRHGSFNWTF